MRGTTNDKTLQKNYEQKFKFLIQEYILVKDKKHPVFKTALMFYKSHNTCAKTFMKYYHRFLQSGGDIRTLVPQKRGPRYKTRRPLKYIEQKVLDLRLLGNGRYEVNSILKPRLKQFTPSPSGIYNIFKRYKVNKMTPEIKIAKRKIVKKRCGEMGHIDCHYLGQFLIKNSDKRYFLLGVIDDCTRITWVEVIDRLTSVDVMFATLKSLNILNEYYGVKFEEILSDNGSEFGGNTQKINKHQHPFERLLLELGVKHRYTRPYRPQTNGKIERFWRTLESELIEGTYFDSLEEFKDELLQYLAYYNQERPHQKLGGVSPMIFKQNLLPN
jgi:transposase InsO family protein